MRRYFSLFTLAVFLFSGVVRSYGSETINITTIASKGDETWFLTNGYGAVAFNKKTCKWNRKPGFDHPFEIFQTYYSKESHGYYINNDVDGYWYYLNGKILNFDRDFKLKKEYCLSDDCKSFEADGVICLYNDGEFIWVVFGSEPYKTYGVNKSTGSKYDYTFHQPFLESAKDVGRGIAAVIFLPFILLFHGGMRE